MTIMERFYWYQGALAVLGLSFLINAGTSFIVGDWSVIPLIFAVSGAGLVLAAGYESLHADPSEFTISVGALLLVTGGACLSLPFTVLDVVSSL